MVSSKKISLKFVTFESSLYVIISIIAFSDHQSVNIKSHHPLARWPPCHANQPRLLSKDGNARSFINVKEENAERC
jgi:hypothetical protein